MTIGGTSFRISGIRRSRRAAAGFSRGVSRGDSISILCCSRGPTPASPLGAPPPSAYALRATAFGLAAPAARPGELGRTKSWLAATAPEARSSRGGGAPRERAGGGPRPQPNNADPVSRATLLLYSRATNPERLRNQLPHHLSVHIGQPEPAALIQEGQPLVIDAEQVQ